MNLRGGSDIIILDAVFEVLVVRSEEIVCCNSGSKLLLTDLQHIYFL